MPSILSANTLSSGYDVDNSLRFNDDSSDYLSQTYSSSGNQRTFTISFWLCIEIISQILLITRS